MPLVRCYTYMHERHARMALERRRLKVSLFPDLNDPFELIAQELARRTDRKAVSGWVGKLSESLGILCFTWSWQNPVMWGHYADCHRGMCLGFDIPQADVLPVRYVTDRLPRVANRLPDAGRSDQEVARHVLTTKSKGWSYEQEVRVIVCLSSAEAEGNDFFRLFDHQLRLREIITGPRCTVGRTAIASWLGPTPASEVDIIRGRLAFRSFRVVKNRQGFTDAAETQGWS